MSIGRFIPRSKTIVTSYRAVKSVYTASVQSGYAIQATFRANSVFDPDYAASGTFNETAAGHTLMSTWYSQYEVLRSAIVVTLRQEYGAAANDWSTISDRPQTWSVTLSPNTNIGVGDTAMYQNDPNTVTTVWTPRPTGHGATRTLKKRFNLRANSSITGDASSHAAVNANPAEDWFFHISSAWLDGATKVNNGPGVLLDVRIYYVVRYFDRKKITTLTGVQQQ